MTSRSRLFRPAGMDRGLSSSSPVQEAKAPEGVRYLSGVRYRRWTAGVALLGGAVLLTACGSGGGGNSPSNPGLVATNGTVSGLSGGGRLLVRIIENDNNRVRLIRLDQDGPFTFNVPENGAYSVAIHSDPAERTCAIREGDESGDAASGSLAIQCFGPKLMLSAATANQKVILGWSAPSQTGTSVLCAGRSAGLFDAAGGCVGQALEVDLVGTTRLEDLQPQNGQTWFYQIRQQIDLGGGERYLITSNEAFVSPREAWRRMPGVTPFNDTGIVRWSDGNRFSDAPVVVAPGQDADHGRDRDAPAPLMGAMSLGHEGFDFTKIAGNSLDAEPGTALSAGPEGWSCLRDNVTGLLWEVRPAAGTDPLRARDYRYTWYNEDKTTNGGASGSEGVANTCGESLLGCNTEAYVQRVNALGLCGYTDWRLPSITELISIVNFNRVQPAVDEAAFPDTGAGLTYWSDTPSADEDKRAWRMNMDSGSVELQDSVLNKKDGLKEMAWFVRLVRGGPDPVGLDARDPDRSAGCQENMRPTAPRSAFVLEEGGIAAGYACQPETGLLWRRCPLGENWTGTGCSTGNASRKNWSGILTQANAFADGGWSDWRLPTIKELLSIVEYSCRNPSVDTRVFPEVPDGRSVSASPRADSAARAWIAQLGSPGTDLEGIGYAYIVREDPSLCPPQD